MRAEPSATSSEGERQGDSSADGKPGSSSGDPSAGTRLSAEEIHENILKEASEELDRPAVDLAMSGLASGLSIGFSFLAVALLIPRMGVENHAIASAIGYPLGFVFVVLARHQLFTENTLEPVIPLLHKRDAETFIKMMRMWGLLLAGNLVGAFVFAFVMQRTVILEANIKTHLEHMAELSTSDGFQLTFIRGIMAGWLIALLTWVMASTQESIAHLVLIWITTAPIAWLDFRHSIVGSVEAFYRVSTGNASLGQMAGEFIAPAVIGNAIGGVVLVALLNYGQVQQERTASS